MSTLYFSQALNNLYVYLSLAPPVSFFDQSRLRLGTLAWIELSRSLAPAKLTPAAALHHL